MHPCAVNHQVFLALAPLASKWIRPEKEEKEDKSEPTTAVTSQ